MSQVANNIKTIARVQLEKSVSQNCGILLKVESLVFFWKFLRFLFRKKLGQKKYEKI